MPGAANAITEVDVLIVGGGPGGSAAAYHLARHGVDVLMAERAAFPREKVCGDGLTPRGVAAIRRMGLDADDPDFERVAGLRVYARRTTIELPWPDLGEYPPFGLVRTRSDFDQLLARRAQSAGARLWERVEATAPVVEDGWVTGANLRRLDERDEPVEVHARYVIAADGAASRFAAQAGVRRDASRPLGIAARRYYRIDHEPGPWFEAWMDLWEGDALLPGYGWLFPLPDGSVNLGAGLLSTFRGFKDVSAQRLFEAFARMLPKDWGVGEETAQGRVLSGPLPMGFNRRPQAVPGMLVVGDAAGLVNPWNGEGIAYAIESGELAAELTFEALVTGRAGVAHLYPTALRERYGRYFHIGRNWARVLGKPSIMRALTEYGLPQKWLMRFALRMMANLTQGPGGDGTDKIMYALERLATTS